jgi:aminopeptidase N
MRSRKNLRTLTGGIALLAAATTVAVPQSMASVSNSGPRPGAETAGDTVYPAYGNGGYDVSHYDVRIRWTASSKRIVATTKITAKAKHGLSRLSLDLTRNLNVGRVLVNGKRAGWRQIGHKLRVTPQRAVRQGTEFRVKVAYAGRPRTMMDPDGSSEGWFRTSDGAVALNQPVGALTWFPNNDTTRDKARFDVRVNVRSGLEVAGNGNLVSRRTAKGRTTWHWRMGRPMSPALSMIGIGQYDVDRRRGADGTPFLSFTDPKLTSPATKAALRKLPRMLAWLETVYGPYPFGSSGLVIERVNSGYALETQTRPVMPGGADPSTTIHELAHQWFGNSVGPRDWNHIWLNEGWAVYTEWLWAHRQGGPTPHQTFRRTFAAHPAGDDFWTVPPGNPDRPENLFNAAIYDRGAMTLQALKERIGSKAFQRLAKRWLGEHKYGTATTAQFIRLAEQVSGKQLDTLFDDWLFAKERPTGY